MQREITLVVIHPRVHWCSVYWSKVECGRLLFYSTTCRIYTEQAQPLVKSFSWRWALPQQTGTREAGMFSVKTIEHRSALHPSCQTFCLCCLCSVQFKLVAVCMGKPIRALPSFLFFNVLQHCLSNSSRVASSWPKNIWQGSRHDACSMWLSGIIVG